MKLCTAPDCNKKHYALGYCRAHHINFKRNGDPVPKYDTSRHERGKLVTFPDPRGRGDYGVNVINDIKYKAEKRGKKWNLSHTEAFSLITSACTYCGHDPEWPKARVGIDRVFNDDGYHVDNCVPCCFTCNSAKGEKSYEEFLEWLKRAYEHNFQNSNVA